MDLESIAKTSAIVIGSVATLGVACVGAGLYAFVCYMKHLDEEDREFLLDNPDYNKNPSYHNNL